MIWKSRQLQLNGHELLLRTAGESDAEMLLQYLKTTSGESRFLIREPEEITLSVEEERRFIRSQNESERSLMLLGFLDGEHVGNCSLMGLQPLRYRHRAEIAVALYQQYTGRGIGKIMLQELFSAAEAKGFEQLELEVIADNKRAIALYQKLGFEIFGTLPHNMKYRDGRYADACFMMKRLQAGQ
ncbi:MAG: GNAT family N-acetyltransferase [Provencibacterium sp.]|nr:GNAT family N-acetyltransferase [Provencibacterium sp.]